MLGCRQGTAGMNSGFRVQRTCSAGARVAEPSRCVMGCRRGTAVSGWFCRRARRCSRSLRRLQRHQPPSVASVKDASAQSMPSPELLTPCPSARLSTACAALDRSTIKAFSSTSNLAHGVDITCLLALCSSHLSAASWISVCVGSVGMTRFMRRGGPPVPARPRQHRHKGEVGGAAVVPSARFHILLLHSHAHLRHIAPHLSPQVRCGAACLPDGVRAR